MGGRRRQRREKAEDVVKDNECGRHRQMRNVYAFSFWNLNEFFIAIHKKIHQYFTWGEWRRKRSVRERKKDPYRMSCHESPLKQTVAGEEEWRGKEEG